MSDTPDLARMREAVDEAVASIRRHAWGCRERGQYGAEEAWDKRAAAIKSLLDRIAELEGRSESHFTRKAKADAKAQYERALAVEAQVSALQAQVDGLREALILARSICCDAFKDTYMEWDEESMKAIDAALNRQDSQHE